MGVRLPLVPTGIGFTMRGARFLWALTAGIRARRFSLGSQLVQDRH